MCTGPDLTFGIDGQPLNNVDHFKYLGSHLSADCQMDYELKSRIQAASCAFGHLREWVFHDLTNETKVKVYQQCIIPILMYGCETWTLYMYQHQLHTLRTVQLSHLRQILRIRWNDHVPNDDVLTMAKVDDIEVVWMRCQLRWIGHIHRMTNERPVKALF